jgi:uncharacterized protein
VHALHSQFEFQQPRPTSGRPTPKLALLPSMLFAITFTDKLGYGEIRAANLQAHIEWLEKNREVVPVGGSLRHELGETPIGGLWIAEAESKAQLEELIKTDPFFIAGLRESYEILHWSKANAQRKALI